MAQQERTQSGLYVSQLSGCEKNNNNKQPKVLTDHGDEIGRKYSRHFSRGVCTSWKHGGWFGERENEGNVWV